MKHIILVGLGGAIGSMLRLIMGGAISHRLPNFKFPLGTFSVNIIGCLFIGVIAGLAEKRGAFSPDVRLFLMTGICGGFTTFSAFAYENIFLLRRGETLTTLLYMSSSIIVGLIATWVGFRAITPP